MHVFFYLFTYLVLAYLLPSCYDRSVWEETGNEWESLREGLEMSLVGLKPRYPCACKPIYWRVHHTTAPSMPFDFLYSLKHFRVKQDVAVSLCVLSIQCFSNNGLVFVVQRDPDFHKSCSSAQPHELHSLGLVKRVFDLFSEGMASFTICLSLPSRDSLKIIVSMW